MQRHGFFCPKAPQQRRISRPMGLTADPIERSCQHPLHIFAWQTAQCLPIKKHIREINFRHLRPKPTHRELQSLLNIAHACGSFGQPKARQSKRI